MEFKDLSKLVELAVSAQPSTSYSFGEETFTAEQIKETLSREMANIAGDYHQYEANKQTIFRLMEVAVDTVLPKKVMEQYGQFAEFQTVSQGDKAIFTQKVTAASRRRAKKFITKVGLAGVYEVFKLDGRRFELPITAIGGAAQISIEEFLDGRLDFNELTEIVMEGIDELIYTEIAKALEGMASNLNPYNTTTQDAFYESAMDQLLAAASAYGDPTIYCTMEFARTMIPDTGWISDRMKDERWNNGYLANYKGTRTIILNQSLVDETNKEKVVDPSYAYIIPTGAEKPIKIAFEGQTLVDDRKNADWSKEIQVYKKLGVGAITDNNIFVYRNVSLTKEITPIASI